MLQGARGRRSSAPAAELPDRLRQMKQNVARLRAEGAEIID
jgi:hypothetical protein